MATKKKAKPKKVAVMNGGTKMPPKKKTKTKTRKA